MPRLKGKELDAAAAAIPQGSPRALKSTGPAREALASAGNVEVIDRPVNKDWADGMAFNEELVKVVLHDSTDKTAEAVPDVYCNGIPQRFIRGQEQVVRRKFLAVLANARLTTYTQSKIRDDDGNESYICNPHRALKYPFTVVEDKNPRGRDWLKALLEQG